MSTKKFLDSSGLAHFWGKAKEYIGDNTIPKVDNASGNLAQIDSSGNVVDSGVSKSRFALSEQGIPSGGSQNQVLAKTGSGNYNVSWKTPSYSDLDSSSKPKINGVSLDGNKDSSTLGLASKEQGEKADTVFSNYLKVSAQDLSSAQQEQVRQNINAQQTITNVVAMSTENASASFSGGTLILGLPKGSDAVNPFKGWYDSSSNLPANPVVGDYAYVEDNGTTYVYRCITAGSWPSTSTEEKEPSTATFASTQLLNNVKIDDSHLKNPNSLDNTNDPVLSKALDVLQLKSKLDGVTREEVAQAVVDWHPDETTSGYYRNESNVPTWNTNSNYKSTRISIPEGCKSIRFLGCNNNNWTYGNSSFIPMYGFADSSGVIITSTFKNYYQASIDGVSDVELTVPVPENAYYFICLYKCILNGITYITESKFYIYTQVGDTVIEAVHFYGGEKLSSTKIIDDVKTGGVYDVLSAEAGKDLAQRVQYFKADGNNQHTVYTNYVLVNKEHKYRLHNFYPNLTIENVKQGANQSSVLYAVYFRLTPESSLQSLFFRNVFSTLGIPDTVEFIAPDNGYLFLGMRFDVGQQQITYLEDLTNVVDYSQIETELVQSKKINGDILSYDREKLLSEDFETIDTGVYVDAATSADNQESLYYKFVGKTLSELTFIDTWSYSGNILLKKIPIDASKYSMAVLELYGNNNYVPGVFVFDGNDVIVSCSATGLWNTTSIKVGCIIPDNAQYMVVPVVGGDYDWATNQKVTLLPITNYQTKNSIIRYPLIPNMTTIENLVSQDYNSSILAYNSNALKINQNFGSPQNFLNFMQFKLNYTVPQRLLLQVIKLDGPCKITAKFGFSYGYYLAVTLDRNGNIVSYLSRNGEYMTQSNECYLVKFNQRTSSIPSSDYDIIIEYSDKYKSNSLYNGVTFVSGVLSQNGESIIKDSKFVTSGFIDAKPLNLTLQEGYRIYEVKLYDSTGKCVNPNFLPFQTKVNAWGTQINKNVFDFGMYFVGYKYRVVAIKTNDGVNFDEIEDATKVVKQFTYIDNGLLKKVIPNNGKYNDFKRRLYAFSNLLTTAKSDQYLYGDDNTQRSIPISGRGNCLWLYHYKNGFESPCIPYSEPKQFAKLVGMDISLKTYITAIQNKRSVMYTERCNASLNSGTDRLGNEVTANFGNNVSKYGYSYSGNGFDNMFLTSFYGSVCTGLTGYLFGNPWLYISGDYAKTSGNNPRIPGMNVLISLSSSPSEQDYQNAANTVQPMDFHWMNGHCSVITDVFKDETGEVRFILWAEHSRPTNIIHCYTKEQFINRLKYNQSTEGAQKFFRYANWETADLSDTYDDFKVISTNEFEAQGNLQIDKDICTFKGDYVTFLDSDSFEGITDNKAYLNIHRNNFYDKLVIFTDDASSTQVLEVDISNHTTYPADSLYPEDEIEDWIIFDLQPYFSQFETVKYGCFKARLHNSNNGLTSGYCHFEVVKGTTQFTPNGTIYTVTYTGYECTPIYLARTDLGGDIRTTTGETFAYKLEYTESIVDGVSVKEGTCPIDTANSGDKYLQVVFRGKYGSVAVKKYIGTNA